MSLLIASLQEHTTRELFAGALAALQSGADMVELRLDGLTQGWDEIPSLVKQLPPYRWIATCRPTSEGGHYDGDLVDRVSLLLAVGSAAPGFIDFEFQDWQRSANIRQKLELATAVRPSDPEHAHLSRAGGRLILSRHYDKRPDDAIAAAREMADADFRGPMKIVWPARDIRDNFEAFEILRQINRPTIAICMGDAGLASRILARKFNAFASYAAARADRPTASGQVDLAGMLGTYRWKSIHPSTRWYGVIGHPVSQSLGRIVHNALFNQHGVDAVYLPLAVDPAAGVLDGFLEGLRNLSWLDFAGASVTLPHKESVRRWLGTHVDELAARIGAVNTLYWADGHLSGTNTDYSGFLASLRDAVGRWPEKKPLPDGRGTDRPADSRIPLKGIGADVLGAGGAARAAVCALVDQGADVCIFNRTEAKAVALAAEFGCRHRSWSERNDSTAPILINTTSMGMGAQAHQCPVEPSRLTAQPLVMDMVFKPLQTQLLKHAIEAGCPTIDGLSMYAQQAAEQFKIWTGLEGKPERLRELALRSMT